MQRTQNYRNARLTYTLKYSRIILNVHLQACVRCRDISNIYRNSRFSCMIENITIRCLKLREISFKSCTEKQINSDIMIFKNMFVYLHETPNCLKQCIFGKNVLHF